MSDFILLCLFVGGTGFMMGLVLGASTVTKIARDKVRHLLPPDECIFCWPFTCDCERRRRR